MKIFTLISSPTSTGKAAALVEFIRQLNKGKHEITVFHDSYRDGDIQEYLDSYGLRHSKSLTLSTIARADLYIRDFFRLAKFLKSEKPDLVICCETNDIICATVACKLAKTSAKIISFDEPSSPFLQKHIDAIIKINTYYSITIHFQSQANTSNIFNSPATVDRQRFRAPTTEEYSLARQQFGFNEDDLVIGSVGRFKNGRGQRRMLEAFHKVKAELPQLKLMLVGFGENLPLIEWKAKQLGLASETVFTGFLTDELASAYHAMNAFVLPVKGRDNLGRAALEATACKTAVFNIQQGQLNTSELARTFRKIAECNLDELQKQQYEMFEKHFETDIEKDFMDWIE